MNRNTALQMYGKKGGKKQISDKVKEYTFWKYEQKLVIFCKRHVERIGRMSRT